MSAVEHPQLVKLANLGENLELIKASIQEGSELEGLTIEKLRKLKKFPTSFQIKATIRDGKTVEEQSLKEEDELIMIGPETDKNKLNNFFRKH